MKEVSCRHFNYWFQLLKKNGRSIDRAIARLPFSEDFLVKPGNRIDWSDYIKFCEDCVEELGGMETVRKIPQSYGNAGEMGYIRNIVGLFASPRKVYEFIILKHGKSLYTHLDFKLIDLPDGRLQIRIRIPDEYEDSPYWFWGSEPSFSSMTQLIGLPPAKIETEVHLRLGIYTLTLPESRTLGRHLKRLGRSLLSPFGYAQFIETQQAELQRLVNELETERDQLTNLIASLPEGILIEAGGQGLFLNTSLRQMLGLTSAEQAPFTPIPESLAKADKGLRHALPTGRLVETVSRSPIVFHGRSAHLIVIRDITALQRIEDRIAEAGAKEREKLAHDLHDGLGQYFAALNFKASAMAGLDQPGSDAMEEVASLAREAATLSNEILHGMGPGYAEGGDIVVSLQKLCRRMNQMFPAQFHFESEITRGKASPTASGELFFLVKEALTNAARHSRAQNISLSILRKKEGWLLAIKDDGCGFHPDDLLERGGGLGLEAMSLRASRLGGHLEIYSEKSGGCEITLDLPSSLLQIPPADDDTPMHRPLPRIASAQTVSRVFVVDDHAIVRDGIRRLIDAVPDLEYCGESAETTTLVPILLESRVDILVIDWMFDQQTSGEAIASIRVQCPELYIVVLTMFEAESHQTRALEAGANDFVHKGDPPERLLNALRRDRQPRVEM